MARTKKQTLVNACERRRQIQEEIRKETLAAKQRREGFSSAVNVHSAQNGVPIANLQTVSRLEKLDNGTGVSSDSVSNPADNCQALRTVNQEAMSSVTHAASDASLYNEGNLPKAVICIPDICRSPTKPAPEEPAVQEQSPQCQGLWGKALPYTHSVKSREESRKCSGSKQSEKNSEDVIASLRSLKAVSEKVREEKRRRSKQATYTSTQASSSGRRSPRQSSSLSSDAHSSASRKGVKDAASFSDEKPKVNIFTDNVGKDLGKRIRSPRRLSEDMIALPIFSARRWSNSPKDSFAASFLGDRSADEISIYDKMETLSLHTPQKKEPAKSHASPTRNKQSSICESSKKSSLPGSKFILCDDKGSTSTSNVTTPDKQQDVQSGGSTSTSNVTTPDKQQDVQSGGSTSTSNVTTPDKQQDVQSGGSSPSIGTKASDFAHEKCIHPQLKQEPLCENTSQTFNMKYSKPGMPLSDQFDNDIMCPVFNSNSCDTRVDDCNSVGGSRKADAAPTSVPIKDDRSKHKKQDDDNKDSSTCKELMSTGMLIKCEKRGLNDTVDSFVDPKTDISDKTGLINEFKKSSQGSINAIDVKINRGQVGSDSEKETNRNKCSLPTAALSFPSEMVEEKPQSSLLCAMLVGGTEVAYSYNQERVRVKSHGGDKSDSELDLVKCESSLPLQATRPADVKNTIQLPGRQSVEMDKLNRQNSHGLLVDKLDKQDSHCLLVDKKSDKPSCDKTAANKNTTAVSSTSEPSASVKIENDMDITEKNTAEVKMEPDQKTAGVETEGGENAAMVEKESDENAAVVETESDNNAAVIETEPVHFYKKLKKVNESVLKLIDIDVEDDLLQALEVDDTVSYGNDEDNKTDTLSRSEQCQSALYSLISSLGTRLQCAVSLIPFSTAVDVELVGKLVESCPKNAPDFIPRLKTATREKLLNKRMEEENIKQISQIHNIANEKELCVGEDNRVGDCVVHHEDSSTATNIDLYSKKDDTHAITITDKNCVEKQAASDVQKMDLDCGSSNMCLLVTHLENAASSHTAAASSDVSESIGQIKKESSVTSLVDQNAGVGKNSLHTRSVIQQPPININMVMPADVGARKISETPSRLSFQKSKTCDDFNERASAHSAGHAWTLRRVNSSPQMNTKQTLPPVSSSSLFSYTAKDSYTKSKLGSKIPVPGTSYITKSQKSWRIPRAVLEPKPLSVLSDLEQPLSQPASAFTCPDLQKYLNVPSNRVIVTLDMQEEMQILDAQAKEQEEVDEKMMEDKDKIMDDDISSDFKNFEPDFDEVDGMLFMSFFSEIELRAHVRVEKALEWDKDDTMLRVSRAKAFEEAKAQNEDMGHYKLKHLRGQHMRWKKYRKMYSTEVKALMEAQNFEQSQDSAPVTKKTSDVSKIKGWKRKNASMPDIGSDLNDNFNWSFDDNKNFSEFKKEVGECFSQTMYDDSMFDDSAYFVSENMMSEDGDKPETSSRSRRRQGFSHQKAHRQLFRELNMDWEDRMIHRKLGGWSLKGNRPQAFSSAAKKRKQQKSRDVESEGFELKDVHIEAGSFEEVELETPEAKDHTEDHSKKKRMIRIIYPLLSEKMARNALKTLVVTGDIQREMKRKKTKARQPPKQLPALTPLLCKSELEDEAASSQLSDCASIVFSMAATLPTPSAVPSLTSVSSPSTSVATAPLDIDLQDEPVMEGVDIAAESISSPSVTDASSMKSCGKPGCRYGCICHLCSANESSVPLPSPLSRQPAPACDKEYCRLGCICESIDHERPISSKTHCRRPSCMLQCVCLDSGSFDGNEDIPYLPSMRGRAKPGDRFSNLPQREKTHRSAKNVDAVTRKALMLYETSEIYCERVERNRKRSDMASSPASTSFDSSLLGAAVPITGSSATFENDIASDPSEESSFQAVSFSADVPEAMGLTPSHPVFVFNTSPQQHQHLTRNNTGRVSKPAFILDDVRQTISMVEPSAHKRKRKSHPLSDEMFISSTCARTQPFKSLNAFRGMRTASSSKDSEELIEISSSVSTDLACATPSTTLLPLPSKFVDVKLKDPDSDSKERIPKISSVHTLAVEKGQDTASWEKVESETPLSHSGVTADSVFHQRVKDRSAHQHTSARNKFSKAGGQGNPRQFHSWHKSMVCLKAKAPPNSQDPGEDDVQEEDEVKLLEFAANCNWEGAKREILAKVAQCLTRGQYPQPKTMNVCEFVVEILPKASHPSHIPAELRAKLPNLMFSIRVRITRRESLIKTENDSDVIDLSGSSPVMSGSGNDSIDSFLKESPYTCTDQKPLKATSDSTFLTSNSVGISGLSKLFISSPPVSGPSQNYSNDNQSLHSSHPGAAHFQRQSLESALVISPDYKPTGHQIMTVQSLVNKPKGSSFLRFGNSVPQKSVGSAFSGDRLKTVPSTSVSSGLKTAASKTASKKMNTKLLSVPQTNQTFLPTSTSSGMAPIFGPFNAKDVKYMMSGKDGGMQLIEIAPTGDKNKKLIAVPIALSQASVDLKGKQSAVVALPASGMGQSRVVPLLSPPTASSQLKTSSATKRITLKFPSAQASSSVKHPVVLQPVTSSVKHPSKFQAVPLLGSSCLTAPQPHTEPTATTCASAAAMPAVCTSSPTTQTVLNSSDEMIMVFDAAHIKASQALGSSVNCAASVSTSDEQDSEDVDHGLSVPASNDGQEICADNTTASPPQNLDTTQAVAVGKVLLEEASVDKRTENVIDDCDNITNNTSEFSINKPGKADFRSEMESVPQEACSSSLHTSDLVVLETKPSFPLPPHEDELLPEAFLEAEVSVDNTVDIFSDSSVKQEILLEDEFVNKMLSENATVRKNYPSIFSNSAASVKEHMPRTLQEFAVAGSKRLISAVSGLEETSFPAMKKPCLAVENPLVLDEDSVASLTSVSGIQQAAASPLSSIDRPKSVMSGALSTGSSEDMLILLSSEEDIDVGEDDKPDDIISYRVRVERALQNDHGNMYTRMDPAAGASQSSLRRSESSDDIVRHNGVSHEDLSRLTSRELQQKLSGKDLQKVNHHNQLERLRRSRMKILFDELQQHVHYERGLPRDHVMSKVKVLLEAKKVVLHLNKCVLEGSEQVKRYERKNRFLQNKLAALKGNLMQQNVSAETIGKVVQRASEKFLLQSVNTEVIQPPTDQQDPSPSLEVMYPVTAEMDIEDSEDLVNLVSPSTDGDRGSERLDVTTPVYEDVSDPEDALTHPQI